MTRAERSPATGIGPYSLGDTFPMAIYIVDAPRPTPTAGVRASVHVDSRTGDPEAPVVVEIVGRTIDSFLTLADAEARNAGKRIAGPVRLTGDMPEPNDPQNDAFWTDLRTLAGIKLPPDASAEETAHAVALRKDAKLARPALGSTRVGTFRTAIVEPTVQYALSHPNASEAQALAAVLSGPIDVEKVRNSTASGPRLDLMATLVAAIKAGRENAPTPAPIVSTEVVANGTAETEAAPVTAPKGR